MSNLLFIGGIHGAGKGTICRKICEQTKLIHLTASNVLKWDEISNVDNKKVKDIPLTQARLIEGLRKYENDKNDYLLDGHFCLFNSHGDVEKIPIETFKEISPKLVIVVTAEAKIIQDRLRNRDDTVYSSETLEHMQSAEVTYATEIASLLKVPFIEIKDCDLTEFINYYRHKLYLTNG